MHRPTARRRALELAAAYALLGPSEHNTQPWRIELEPDRLSMRADRSCGLTVVDPRDRALVRTVGAAVFNARVALADGGWASTVDRLPCTDDPDLLAVVRACAGAPDPALAALSPAVTGRGTHRRRFRGADLPETVLRRLTEIAESEGVLLIPVVDDARLRLVEPLTREADGFPADEALPGTRPDIGRTMVLLATQADDPPAWLRAGEALEHVLLELTRLGWVGDPVAQAIEVPLTRTRLRSALTWSAHPQMLLRIGQAPPPPPNPRRHAGATGRLPSDAAALVPEPATSG